MEATSSSLRFLFNSFKRSWTLLLLSFGIFGVEIEGVKQVPEYSRIIEY